MQKRKSPIALITVLVVLLVVGAVVNVVAQGTKDGKEVLVQTAAPKETGAPRATDSKEALAINVQQGAAATGTPGGPTPIKQAGTVPMGPKGVPGGPLVSVMSSAQAKPKPNESSVQGQWWSTEHAKVGATGGD